MTHQAGSTAVAVDQRAGGGQWVPLGSFEMAPGAGHKVTLSGEAEAFAGAAETIVDNRDPAALRIGAWGAGTGLGGGMFWDADIERHDPGTGAARFVWPAKVAEAGRYAVHARWTAWPDRATDAPYRVHHAGGTTTVRVNQQGSGGAWVFLGIFDLDPGEGHRVELGHDANGTVIADAVRFSRDAAAAVPAAAEIMEPARLLQDRSRPPAVLSSAEAGGDIIEIEHEASDDFHRRGRGAGGLHEAE